MKKGEARLIPSIEYKKGYMCVRCSTSLSRECAKGDRQSVPTFRHELTRSTTKLHGYCGLNDIDILTRTFE